LGRRFAGMQGDQLQLGELLEIKIDVHSPNASVGCTTCQSNYGNQLNFGRLPWTGPSLLSLVRRALGWAWRLLSCAKPL
jgi:hypothetical protein